MTSEDFRAALVSTFRLALSTLDPKALVHRALGPWPGGKMSVIAAGKAASRMADGVDLAYAGEDYQTLVVAPGDGLGGEPDLRDTELGRRTTRYAAHPIPDERSLAAGAEALRRAQALGKGDRLVALISGGASSLLAALPPGMTLAQKQKIITALLECGAPITDVNTVRRHLSPLKGGGLAAAARPADVTCFVLSDVVDGRPCDIASGPAVGDPTTLADARACTRRWIPEHLASLSPHLRETLEPSAASDVVVAVLADPEVLGRAMARALTEHMGLAATVLAPEALDLDATVRRRVELARKLAPGEALVVPCEPTVALPGRRGRGGRAGRVALEALPHLPPTVFLLCAASDGVDGSSGAAGAVVCGADAARVDVEELDRARKDFDDASVHHNLGTSIAGGATGTNLTDVHVLARPRERR